MSMHAHTYALHIIILTVYIYIYIHTYVAVHVSDNSILKVDQCTVQHHVNIAHIQYVLCHYASVGYINKTHKSMQFKWACKG